MLGLLLLQIVAVLRGCCMLLRLQEHKALLLLLPLLQLDLELIELLRGQVMALLLQLQEESLSLLLQLRHLRLLLL